MSATYPNKLIVAFRSGDHCALPGCSRKLTVDGPEGGSASTGEAAHIAGEKPDAARYVDTMTDAERNDVANLIYLCGDCHTKIDKLENDWPIPELMTIKSEHEAKVAAALEEAFTEVNFPELEKAMAWLRDVDPAKEIIDFALLTPEHKIKKNNLSNGTRNIITSGLASQKVVSEFIESETRDDAAYPDRLKSGFLSEYYRLRARGIHSNQLFELMCVFAQRSARNQAERTAGIAVLVYLFEICDVFEK
jgi:hypothetical protein